MAGFNAFTLATLGDVIRYFRQVEKLWPLSLPQTVMPKLVNAIKVIITTVIATDSYAKLFVLPSVTAKMAGFKVFTLATLGNVTPISPFLFVSHTLPRLVKAIKVIITTVIATDSYAVICIAICCSKN